MPAQHSHHDRGALHDDCPACITVAKLLGEAGVPAHQISDLRRDPAFSGEDFGLPIAAHRVRTAAEEHVRSALRNIESDHTPRQQASITINNPSVFISDDRPDLDIEGQEMGNKANVDADRSRNAEIDWLTDLLAKIESQVLGYSQAVLHSHLYRDHDLMRAPLSLPLRSLQEVHAGSHYLHQGHGGSPEHMVERISREALRGRLRLLEQKRWSNLNTGLKAEQHRRRERSARESRQAVMIESARSLKRAIEHTRGTVLPRVNFDAGGNTQVSITVGIKDRITIAAASIGHDTAIGTAICHPSDRFDEEVGRQLAIARSLVALGAVHELEWMARVEERNA